MLSASSTSGVVAFSLPFGSCKAPHEESNLLLPFLSVSPSVHALHAQETTTASLSTARSFSLHLLGDLDIDVEEFADTAVKADGFAGVEFGFAVLRRDALGCAGFYQTGWRENVSEDVRSKEEYNMRIGEKYKGQRSER